MKAESYPRYIKGFSLTTKAFLVLNQIKENNCRTRSRRNADQREEKQPRMAASVTETGLQ